MTAAAAVFSCPKMLLLLCGYAQGKESSSSSRHCWIERRTRGKEDGTEVRTSCLLFLSSLGKKHLQSHTHKTRSLGERKRECVKLERKRESRETMHDFGAFAFGNSLCSALLERTKDSFLPSVHAQRTRVKQAPRAIFLQRPVAEEEKQRNPRMKYLFAHGCCELYCGLPWFSEKVEIWFVLTSNNVI